MRITIIQSEIEEAIAEKVLSQMSINDNMELKIELSATRGPEGYTATIDVVAKAEDVIELPKRAGRKANTTAATTPKAESEPVTEDAPSEDKAEEPKEEPAAEAPKTGSIFANLKKPVNAPAEI